MPVYKMIHAVLKYAKNVEDLIQRFNPVPVGGNVKDLIERFNPVPLGGILCTGVVYYGMLPGPRHPNTSWRFGIWTPQEYLKKRYDWISRES